MSDLITRLAGSTGRSVTTASGRAAVRLVRRYETDAADLWAAITDPERAARWVGDVSGDMEEGGTVRLCMSPPDADVAMLEVIRCDRPRRLVVRWQEEGRPGSVVDVELVPDAGGGCELHLEHVAIDDAADYGCGWEDCLLQLDQHLRGQVPAPMAWDDVKAALGPAWSAAATADDGRWPSVDDGVIRARHVVDAAQPVVWAALTDPAVLSQWFAAVSGDTTVDGTWTATFDQGGCSGTVRQCDPGSSFATTWTWDHEPGVGLVSVTLRPADGRTAVEVVHEDAGGASVGYAAGWYAHLRGLDTALHGRDRDERDWQADWTTAMVVLSS